MKIYNLKGGPVFGGLTQTIDAQAQPAEKQLICHVPDTPFQTVPFATGHVIEINKNACEAHCTNHGGDHVIGDGSCANDIICCDPDFPGQCVIVDCPEDECIVNSPQPFCSVNRCIFICENR